MNERDYDRKVLEQNNEGDPIGGDGGARPLIGMTLSDLLKRLQYMQDLLVAGGEEYATPVIIDGHPIRGVELRSNGYVVIHSLRREVPTTQRGGPGVFPLLDAAVEALAPVGFHTHASKGGGYMAKGFAKGAGTLNGISLALYQSTGKDQTYYIREPSDFNEVMVRPAAQVREHLVDEYGKDIGLGPAAIPATAVPDVWAGYDKAAVDKSPGVGAWLVEPEEDDKNATDFGDIGDIGE